MSEKHLTELPWKVLATKQGVKDLGLAKALAGYTNIDAGKEPAKALDALKEIAELAGKLKKANPTKAEVVAHLDEVVKEVKKTTPSLEAKLKSPAATTAEAPAAPAKPAVTAPAPAKPAPAAKPVAEAEDEEKVAAEFKKDLRQQMVSALAQVKARAPGEPEQQKDPKPQLKFMAYLAGKSCAVIVARMVGSATKKLLPDIAGVATGGQFVTGECIFEKNTHTFVVDKVPGGLAKKLAAALHTETGQKYKVRVRNADGSVTVDSDTDVDPDAAPPAAGGQEIVRFTERLTALLPQIKAMPQLKVAVGTKDEKGLNVVASEAVFFAKSKNYSEANRLLDVAEALLKKTAAPPQAPPAPGQKANEEPPPPPQPPGVDVPGAPPAPGAKVPGAPPAPGGKVPGAPPATAAKVPGAPPAPGAPGPGQPAAAPKPPAPARQAEEAAEAGRLAARQKQADLDKKLKERDNDRQALKEPLSEKTVAELAKVNGGDQAAAALKAFQAIKPDAKNSANALALLDAFLAQGNRWLGQADVASPKPSPELIQRMKATREAAQREKDRLTVIRKAVTTLATPSPDFETTGEWNKTGGVRIKGLKEMPVGGAHGGPPDNTSPERLADTRRQVAKLNVMLEAEVSRSDAFAELLAEAMNEAGGKSFNMFVGKGTAGAWDDYGSLGVDVDDLDCLPTDPQPVQDGATKGGITKGEILAHVLEERMYGYKGETQAAYIDAHQLCLSPGSYQNRHRRELGIPADSILYDNCKHAHTAEGCACFEGTDSQGVKTIVHDMPTDLKGNNKPLGEIKDIKVPDATRTEVVREFASEQETYDALIAKAVVVAKAALFDNPKDSFEWNKAYAQNLLHFISCAEKGDKTKIEARKAKIKQELDGYQKNALNKAVLKPDLEKEKNQADLARAKGDTKAELALDAQRKQRPAAINVGSSADGSTNCAMCTLGAILNLTSEDAARAGQGLCGKKNGDPKMQSEKLFYNAFLGIDDNTPDEQNTRLPLLKSKLGDGYLNEVKDRLARKNIAEASPKFWQTLQGEIMGDFQFEGLRLMLEKGIAERNKNSDVQYEVVQDGLPTEGKMHAWAGLVAQMKQYPDGTQFQVFVRGPEMPGHWIYADKVKGNVLFEDYQKNEVKVVEKQSVVLPKDVTAAKRDFAEVWNRVWKEKLAEFKKEQNIDAGENLNGMQEGNFLKQKVIPVIRASSTTTKEQYTVPNSAYVAGPDNSPRHPQSDKKEVFKEGMFLAVMPKGQKKPAPKDSTSISAVRQKLMGGKNN